MGLLSTVFSVIAVDQEFKLTMPTQVGMVNQLQTPSANNTVQPFAMGAC